MTGRRLFRMIAPSGPPVTRVARRTAIVVSAAALALVGGVGPVPALASQPRNQQVSPVVASTVATATAPSASTATCTSKDVTVTLPSVKGVIYTPKGALTLPPGGSVTVTATAAERYTLAGGTHEWTFKNDFDPATCKQSEATATATAPTPTTPACASQSVTVTLPTTTGVIYTPSGSLSLAPGESVTVTASAAAGYTLAEGTHEWAFKNDLDPATCEAPEAVTPETPTTTKPSCDVRSMTVTLPTTVGVSYTPNGALTLAPGESVTITATAKDGYVLTEDATTEWSFTNTFDPSTCTKVVTAEPPSSSPATCSDFGYRWIFVPSVEGVIYTVTGASEFDPEWSTGEWLLDLGGSATITASADTGYVLSNGDHQWTFRNDLNVASCAISVKATPPNATTPTCSAPFMTVTLPVEEYHGVIYDEKTDGDWFWSDKPLELRPGESVIVGAYLDWDWFPFGYIGEITLAAGSGPWRFKNTFDPTSCNGASTENPSAGVAGAEAGSLAGTGAGPIRTEVAWAIGLLLAGGALMVTTRKGRRGRRAL